LNMANTFRLWLRQLHRKSSSIKVRTLMYMLGSLLIIVFSVMNLVYGRVEALILNSQYKISDAEMKQIASHMSGIYHDINLKIDMLLFNQTNHVIYENGLYSELEKVYAYQSLSRNANDILNQSKYLESIYMFINPDNYVYITKNNFKRSVYPDYTPFSAKMEKALLAEPAWQLRLVGGVLPSELPYTSDASSKKVFVSAVKETRQVKVLMNIDERYFNSYYDQMSIGSGRSYCILNNAGEVVSFMGNKDQEPVMTEILKTNDITRQGSIERNGGLWFWMPIAETTLTLFMSIPLVEYYQSLKDIQIAIFLLSAIAMGAMGTMFVLWIRRVFSPLGVLLTSMNDVGNNLYRPIKGVRGHSEIAELIGHYNKMLQRLQALTVENQNIEAQKRRNEIIALRNQINPHFLYNTLNSIRWMAFENEDHQVVNCITLLGKIITPLYRVEDALHSLSDEFKMLDSYIEIMNISHGDGIVYRKCIDPCVEQLMVMRFLLQPIVENCITHGFDQNNYRGSILVCASIIDEKLCIQIIDDGAGMEEREIQRLNEALSQRSERIHNGMLNSNQRILLQYGEPYGIRVYPNCDHGLKVSLLLPVITESEKEINRVTDSEV